MRQLNARSGANSGCLSRVFLMTDFIQYWLVLTIYHSLRLGRLSCNIHLSTLNANRNDGWEARDKAVLARVVFPIFGADVMSKAPNFPNSALNQGLWKPYWP